LGPWRQLQHWFRIGSGGLVYDHNRRRVDPKPVRGVAGDLHGSRRLPLRRRDRHHGGRRLLGRGLQRLDLCGVEPAMHLAYETLEGQDEPPQQEPKQQNNGFKRLIGKKFFWELKNHYLKGEGEDVFLTKEQFTELIIHGKIDYANAELGEDGYYTTSISFYETNDDLHYSFGTATVKYKVLDDNKNMYLGFKDTYNFDPKPWGVRSFKNEVITRTYNIISNGTDFSIYYNKTLF
jgi:hypothetical protein